MSEEFFDRFEDLTPSGRKDVSTKALGALLKEIQEPSDETKIAIKVMDSFEKAQTFQVPDKDRIHLWLGYCVGGFHEEPRREDYFIFALNRQGDSQLGYATGIEEQTLNRVNSFYSETDVRNISEIQIVELLQMLNASPPPSTGKLKADWFSPLIHTDGLSKTFSPICSAKYYIRQDGDKLIFVQPSRCGGWYGELWPIRV